MARETLPRERVALPELDAEDEVDLGRYWSRLVAAWWIVALGLLLGIIGGYLYGKRSPTLWEAKVDLYPGNPLIGDSPLPTLNTNPRTISELVHSEFVIKQAAHASGIRVGRLRGHVSSKTLTPEKGSVKAGQTQFVQVTVTGSGPKKVERAANTIANTVVERLSRLVDVKIAGFKRRLRVNQAALDSVERRIGVTNAAIASAGAKGLSPLEQLVLVNALDNAEQRRQNLVDEQSAVEQDLATAEQVEKPQLLTQASAQETTARSVRNSTLVGAVLGLILGAIAALLWEPARRRWRREPL